MNWKKLRLVFCKMFVFVALWTLVFSVIQHGFNITEPYVYAMVGYFFYPIADEVDSWITNSRLS
jgi:hypothetical protein